MTAHVTYIPDHPDQVWQLVETAALAVVIAPGPGSSVSNDFSERYIISLLKLGLLVWSRELNLKVEARDATVSSIDHTGRDIRAKKHSEKRANQNTRRNLFGSAYEFR